MSTSEDGEASDAARCRLVLLLRWRKCSVDSARMVSSRQLLGMSCGRNSSRLSFKHSMMPRK